MTDPWPIASASSEPPRIDLRAGVGAHVDDERVVALLHQRMQLVDADAGNLQFAQEAPALPIPHADERGKGGMRS
jgi:hypothetical protein